MQLHACPYPGTCRYYGEEKGAPRCRRETCPFRIHLRRMVAGEMQRLAGKGDLTPAQRRELEVLKKEYARLLGGEAHGTEAPKRPAAPRAGGGWCSSTWKAVRASGSLPCQAWRWPWLFQPGGAGAFRRRPRRARFPAAGVGRLLGGGGDAAGSLPQGDGLGARFILQTAFGYGERSAPDLGPITVQVEDGEGGET